MKIAVHFIRARNNLLSCSSGEFPIYIRYSVGRERGAGYRKEREGGRVVRTVIVVIIFLKLTSRSIFDNRENRLPYFTYVVTVISV